MSQLLVPDAARAKLDKNRAQAASRTPAEVTTFQHASTEPPPSDSSDNTALILANAREDSMNVALTLTATDELARWTDDGGLVVDDTNVEMRRPAALVPGADGGVR